MLKRRLLKAGLVTTGFVLIAGSSGSKPIPHHPGDSSVVCPAGTPDSSFVTTHIFDAEGLCTCLPELSMEELAAAPRVQLNAQAKKFVTEHLKKNTPGLEKIRTKSKRYFTLIDSVFTSYGLPVELKYLAVIESKLNTYAMSRVGARGLWQFMPVTAKRFGLKIKGKYDERILAYKSTVAAAKYLSYLHGLFDDWLLAVAAYNSGPGYIYAAIRKSGSRNFWKLQGFLPLETRNHVKKFISIHYFFEGRGGETTLTKHETQAHIKAVSEYIARQKEKEMEAPVDTLPDEKMTVTASNNFSH